MATRFNDTVIVSQTIGNAQGAARAGLWFFDKGDGRGMVGGDGEAPGFDKPAALMQLGTDGLRQFCAQVANRAILFDRYFCAQII